MESNSFSHEGSRRPEESKLIQVKTTSLAPEFEPIEQVPHAEIFAAPDCPKLKVSPRAITFDTEQAPILAQFWLNTPLQDGLLTVNALYQEIKKTVIKYHLDHNDAFYSQYPELLITKDGETPDEWSNEYLRINHRKFDRRLAHYIWHYHNACCMLIGAAANMCILGQVSGSGKYRDFGEAFKIGRINNILNRYDSFFKCVNIEDYIIHFSRFATGFTTYDAVIAAFPLWITDVIGNRGFGSFNWTDAFDGVKANGLDVNQIDSTSQDFTDYFALLKNMEIVRGEFVRDDIVQDPNDSKYHHANRVADANQRANISIENAPENFKHCAPSMSKVENQSTVTFWNPTNGAFTMKADSGTEAVYVSNTKVKVGSSQYVEHDNIINRVWDTLNYWLEYVETYFNKFSQPTSQLVIFCQEHGWIDKKTITSASLFTRIKQQALSKPFDMKSIREEMIYKRDNDVTTANLIKFMPIVDRYYGSWKDAVDFDRNFNRYSVDEDDPVGVVLKSRQFPGLTPAIFHDLGTRSDEGVNEPHVANAITTGSTQVIASEEGIYPLHGILGKYASYLDYASSSHIDAEETAIDIIALDSSVAKEFIKKANGIVLAETMDYPRAFSQPLIDRTDPFQCGFNVVMFCDSKTQNEFERFYKDPSRYERAEGDTDPKDVYTPDDSVKPSSPTFGVDSNNKYKQMSLLNADWCNANRYSFLFVGDSIWYLPENIPAQIGAGNYLEEFQKGSFLPDRSNLNATLTSLDSALTTIKQEVQPTLGDYFQYNGRNADTLFEVIAGGLVGALATDKRYAVPGLATMSIVDMVSSLVNNVKNNAQGSIDTALFSPLYGAVDIRKYDAPYLGLAIATGLVEQAGFTVSTLDPKFRIGDCRVGVTDHAEYTIGQNVARIAYDSYRSIAQFLLWPIDQIRIKKTLRQGRRLFVPEKFIDISGFSGAAKTAYALLSRSRVMYPGAEDTYFLNSVPSDKVKFPDKLELGSGSPFNFGSLIEPPIVRESRIPNRASFSRYNKPVKINTASASNDAFKGGNPMNGGKFGSDKKSSFDSGLANHQGNKAKSSNGFKKFKENKFKAESKLPKDDQESKADPGSVEKVLESANQNASDSAS